MITSTDNPMRAPLPLEQAEIRSLPARLLAKLPSASVFYLYVAESDALVEVYTRELPEPRAALGNVVLDGLELQALVTGACCDRFQADDLAALCEAKRIDPRLRLSLEDTLDGALGAPEGYAAPLSVGALLDRLGASLVGLREHGPGAPRAVELAA